MEQRERSRWRRCTIAPSRADPERSGIRLVRRLRARLVTSHSGGPGYPPAGMNETGCRQWLHAAGDEGRRKLPGSGSAKTLPSCARKRGTRDRKAASGAPRGAPPLRKRRGHASQACRAVSPTAQGRVSPRALRFPALRSTHGGEENDDGVPRAAKDRGGGALATVPPSFRGASQRVRAKRGPMINSASEPGSRDEGTARGSGFRVRR
jgi:hypothetical protein